jgi:hypothetical protein
VVGAPLTGATEEYDGNTWATSNPLNTARNLLGNAGIQTAGLAFGGETGPALTGATEAYAGNSWTNSKALKTTSYTFPGKQAHATSSSRFWWSYSTSFRINRRIRWS